MIETDLFEFAYVPDWYGQLEQLAEMALPEHGDSESHRPNVKIQIRRFWNGISI